MRLADRGFRRGPRCAPHDAPGTCDCQDIFLRSLAQQMWQGHAVDWRQLYSYEVEPMKQILYEEHAQAIEQGDITAAGKPNAALVVLERLEREDGFRELDEAWL